MKPMNAEDAPYWKTGEKTPPEGWLERACKEIVGVGGKVIKEMFASADGKAAYLIEFSIDGETYRLTWPVLKCKSAGNEAAARRQATTALYHDVKARCVTVKFLGSRTAFIPFLVLSDGQTVSQASTPDLASQLLLLGGG